MRIREGVIFRMGEGDCAKDKRTRERMQMRKREGMHYRRDIKMGGRLRKEMQMRIRKRVKMRIMEGCEEDNKERDADEDK